MIGEQLGKERNIIGYTATSLYNYCFRRFQFIDHEDEKTRLNMADQCLLVLENYYNFFSLEQIPEYMGGEFSHKYLGDVDNLTVVTTYYSEKIPLFLFLDIAIKALKENYIYNYEASLDNKEFAQELLEKIINFREKIVVLPHNPIFNSNKHISDEAWYGISNGTFAFSIVQEERLKHVKLSYQISRDDGVLIDGDNYSSGQVNTSGSSPYYEEDYKEISKRIEIKREKEAEEFYAEFRKYFKYGCIPNYQNMKRFLIDRNIDERIFEELKKFCIMYAKYGEERATEFALSNTGKKCLDSLIKTENSAAVKLAEKQKQAAIKRIAINNARARYRKKSLFWRAMNQHLNPDKIRMELLDTDQINELYIDEGKKSK